MNKLISLLLSIALLFGNITSSFAQAPLSRLFVRGVTPKTVGGIQATVSNAMAKQLLSKDVLSLSTIRQFTLPEITLSLPEANSLVNQIFHQNRSPESTRQLILGALPELVFGKRFTLSPTHIETALSFTRKHLLTPNTGFSSLENLSFNELQSHFSEKAKLFPKLLQWSENMAAVSNIGFWGKAETDTPLLLEAYRQSPQALRPVAATVIGRALLNLQAYEGLEALAKLCAVDGKLIGGWWPGLAEYASYHKLPLSLPEVVPGEVPCFTEEVRSLLVRTNHLNASHFNLSAQNTADWVALKKNPNSLKNTDVSLPKIHLENSYIFTVPSAENLSLRASPLSVGAPISLSGSEAVAAGTERTVAQEHVELSAATSSSTSGTLYSLPFPFPVNASKKVWGNLRKYFTTSPKKQANRNAKDVLSKLEPLNSQLRIILQSPADATYKKQALFVLYKRGVFSNKIQDFPETTQALFREDLENLAVQEQVSQHLLRLYESKFFDAEIAALADIPVQGRISDELTEILTSPDWAPTALAAYQETKVLPLEGENFEGTVPALPEVTEEVVLQAIRDPNFAVKNASSGVGKKVGWKRKDMIHYENNIPFYYRNSKGVLSSSPVGILTQEQTSLYGRALSFLKLASKPGIYLPKGFVLALDEQGQWKLVMPAGGLSVVETSKSSMAVLKKIQEEGSVRWPVDTPYNSSELLAFAKLLEKDIPFSLELTLNKPHSLKQFLKLHGYFVGNDAGNSMAGPFKKALKNSAIPGVNALAAIASGVGYVTPMVGAWMMPLMTKWGNVKTTRLVYGGTALSLGAAIAMGVNGVTDPTTLNLWYLSIPTLALVLGASLSNTFIQTFLNFYKDPISRTSAHLNFSEDKQWSRLGLVVLTALASAFFGLNWTLVAPVGLGLVGLSSALFRNTPIFEHHKRYQRALDAEAAGTISPADQLFLKKIREVEEQEVTPAERKAYKLSFKSEILKTPEVKDIIRRVRMVYASYAASLLAINQTTTALLGDGWGLGVTAAFMFGTAMTRKKASKWVKENILTDNQLTGASLPLLAITGGILAFMPYVGPVAGILAGTTGILHYMATAVPGQLDAARMQNIVSAAMQEKKLAVHKDASLSEAQRAEKLKKLEKEEKEWASNAASAYSFANSFGLAGIFTVAGVAALFSDLPLSWTQDLLASISMAQGGEALTATINRFVLLYSSVMAGVLTYKNWNLVQDFIGFFKRKKVTSHAILNGEVSAGTFGIDAKNAKMRLVEVDKTLKKLETDLVDFGVMSEYKMTKILLDLIVVNNRLVAAKEVLQEPFTESFEKLQKYVKTFGLLLEKNSDNLSVNLSRSFENLRNAIFVDAEMTIVREAAQYTEEGVYRISKDYKKYEEAKFLINEVNQLGFSITHGEVHSNTYSLFVKYHQRAQTLLQQYKMNNLQESAKVAVLNKRLEDICKGLKVLDEKSQILSKNGQNIISKKDIQELRDLLSGY